MEAAKDPVSGVPIVPPNVLSAVAQAVGEEYNFFPDI
jgi:hypothetical protein